MALPTQEFFTADELAAILRVSRKTVLRMARRGALACHQFGRTRRFRRQDVEAFLETSRIVVGDLVLEPRP
jgi:excisionase family DNA binding protein